MEGRPGRTHIFNSALSGSRHLLQSRATLPTSGAGKHLAQWTHLQIYAPSFIAWSDVQSFTTPTTISAPCAGCPVGGQLRHHLSGPWKSYFPTMETTPPPSPSTTATTDGGHHPRFMGLQCLLQQRHGSHYS